jgi:hypothetical protein
MTFPAFIDLSTILLATSESCTLSVVLSKYTISPVLASIAKCIFRYPLLLEYLLSSHEPDLLPHQIFSQPDDPPPYP